MITFLNKIIQWSKSQIKQLKSGDFKIFNHKIKKLILLFFIFILILFFFPLFLIIRIISNFILIRFGLLPSRRIGHFANDVNLYLCTFKKKTFFQYDFFYPEKPICNFTLLKIYKKYLIVLPEIFILPFVLLNKIKFLGSPKHNIKLNPYAEAQDLRDRDIDDKKINYFNQKDIQLGYSFLKDLGLSRDDKFVCLLCRDEEYVKNLFKQTYDVDYRNYGDISTFRNSNIENFRLVSEYLTGLGYYVFRMGEKVSKSLSINNKRFFDYATSGKRNEFLDIFLSSHCDFFITTGSGLDILPAIFDRPIVLVSCAQVGWTRSSNKKQLTIFKHFKNKNDAKNLTLSEIFDFNLAGAKTDIFKEKQVEVIENTPEEIKEAVIDMLELMKNNFVVSEQNSYLQSKFWNLFKEKINKHGLTSMHANFFKSHIGYSFLKKNKNFLE